IDCRPYEAEVVNQRFQENTPLSFAETTTGGKTSANETEGLCKKTLKTKKTRELRRLSKRLKIRRAPSSKTRSARSRKPQKNPLRGAQHPTTRVNMVWESKQPVMKFHFEPNLDFQRHAIDAVCDLFRGQDVRRTEFTVIRDPADPQQRLG